MTRYYCDYRDTYLTHDSTNVRTYYQQFEERQTQQTEGLIDQRVKEHHQQVGAALNQHLMGQRPHLPVPMMPMVSGIRPPVYPRPPPGAPGYMPTMPPMMAPPGAPTLPGQLNSLPRPHSFAPSMSLPGNTAPPNSNAQAA